MRIEKKLIESNICGLHFCASFAHDILQAYWQSSQLSSFKLFQAKYLTGQIVNESEGRAAWHTAFRNPSPNKRISDELAKIKNFSEAVRADKSITDVVNIGIGGSDLGPKLVCEALDSEIDGPRTHFVSNLDSVQINQLLKTLSARNTLFIVTSKSFKTLDTCENMQIAMAWLISHGVSPQKQMVAVTQNHQLVKEKYQFLEAHIFNIPEWVGGRFSLWTAVGLSCAIAFGFEKFYTLHQGANEMDEHFASSDVAENLPILYATQLFHAITHQGVKTLGILPYAHRLRSFPAFLQQLFMESLGKRVNTQGEPIDYLTGPIVYGGVGSNAQHSFQQLLMQGSHHIFADFILPLSQSGMDKRSQAMMAANCIAQVNTLRDGAENVDPRRVIEGQQIANLFVLEKLDHKTLGALIAFYEHAVVTLAYLLDINPFDQWGVEYAKQKSNVYFNQFDEKLLCIETINQLVTE